MNTNVEIIYEVIEDIKETITDNQYKTIMDNLMVLNKEKKKEEEEEELADLDRQISFLNRYIPTIDDNEVIIKNSYIRRLDLLQFMYSVLLRWGKNV